MCKLLKLVCLFLYKLKALPHLPNQLFLALIGNCNVLDQSGKVCRSIACQHERVTRFAEEVDEITIMARRNVGQSAGNQKHIIIH